MQLLTAFDAKLIIPIGLFLAGIWSAYRGYKASKSGSTIQNRDGSTTQSNENVPYLKTAGGAFSVIFFVIAIIVTIIMINER